MEGKVFKKIIGENDYIWVVLNESKNEEYVLDLKSIDSLHIGQWKLLNFELRNMNNKKVIGEVNKSGQFSVTKFLI